ncbi:MAG: bifunctional serine/threonine-protein kinase/formylglycine-generating enzyme family protein [Chloroflexota bacterium]
MTLATGTVLNQRYRIVKLLGQGGFGAVYRAWDLALKRPCAVKENLAVTAEAQRQFEREARLLANLSHPNLPRVIDHFSLPGQGQYLVMDFVEGQDLDELMQQAGGPLPEARLLPWIGQICEALEYLHRQNPAIIHRDIKPGNIRITPQGQAMLVDFGIAKIYDPRAKTTVGARAVTPGYSPTEQYGQGSTDARTDIYALGATLYNLLTNQTPVESVQRTLGAPLPAPSQYNPHISPNTEHVVLHAMALLPEQRFASIGEFRRSLVHGDQAPQVLRTAQMAAPQTASYSPPVSSTARMPVAPAPTTAAPAPTAVRQVPWGWIGAGVIMLLVVSVALLAGGGLTSESARATSLARTATALALNPTSAPAVPSDTPSPEVGHTPASFTSTPYHPPTETPYLPPSETPYMPPSETAYVPPTATPWPTDTPPTAPQIGDSQVSSVDGMQMIYVGGFWIDRTEVTNAMYALCVRAGACPPPAEASSNTRDDYYGSSSYANYPVVKINVKQASAYCAWAGRRLPTTAEWQKAAGKQSGSTYPWGNDIDCNYANIKMGDNFCVGDTSAVGSYPLGASPVGALDMAGNVFEWVSDRCSQGNTVLGGCWNDGPEAARLDATYCRTPDSTSSKLGFRCAQ